jgi:hypothetical protein
VEDKPVVKSVLDILLEIGSAFGRLVEVEFDNDITHAGFHFDHVNTPYMPGSGPA